MLLRAQARGKTDGPEHSQRVVGIGLFRLQRGSDDAGRQVPDASERIHQGTVVPRIEAEGHGVDGEVSPQLVFLQRAILHDGFTGIPVVAFLPGSHKLHLHSAVFEHRRSEIPEHAHAGVALFGHGLGQADAAPLHHNVYVVIGLAQETIPHVAPYHEGPYAQFPGRITHQLENRMSQVLFC